MDDRQVRNLSRESHESPSLTSRFRDFFVLSANKKVFSSENIRNNSGRLLLNCKRETVLNEEACSELVEVLEKDSGRQSFDFATDTPASPARLVVSKDRRPIGRDACARRIFSAQEQRDFDQSVSHNKKDDVYSSSFHRGRETLACTVALSIPEIVENILQKLDEILWQSNSSLLTRGNRKSLEMQIDRDQSIRIGPVYSCLTVDRMFNWAAKRIISRRIELNKLEQFERYSVSMASSDNLCRDLLVHRIKTCDQALFDSIKQYRLRSLELYVCPKLVPNQRMLVSGTLIKLALPGCGLVNDIIMAEVARYCPLLEVLDLRACELVTDQGIIEVANNCPRLSYLNVGRVKNAGAITDKSMTCITQKTSVETLGLAGCAISDCTVLAIAHNRGHHIERLSMNQCHAVTDYSINALLQYSPKLQVLEVVGCEYITDAKSLCSFKISSGALVETSDVLAFQIQKYEDLARQKVENRSSRANACKLRIATK